VSLDELSGVNGQIKSRIVHQRIYFELAATFGCLMSVNVKTTDPGISIMIDFEHKTYLSPKDDEEDSASDVESVQDVDGAAFNPKERISRTIASFPCPCELT
jgi:hypothetical protein